MAMKEPQDDVYYAHSANGADKWQTMEEHATEVACRARKNAEPFGEQDTAHLTGLIHDLGKYGDLFQKRIRGEGSGLDHWAAGAWMAAKQYRSLAVALAIQGHHIGLQEGTPNAVKEMDLAFLASKHPLNLRLTEADLDALTARLKDDGITLPPAPLPKSTNSLTDATMLDVRMLFSALVDADFLDTERHMNEGKDDRIPRPEAPSLQPRKALECLERRLQKLNANEEVPAEVRALRADLANACRDAAQQDGCRLWTLTAPTGTGKTLAMLRFALELAARDPEAVRHIIVVLPYLSIIDQTVRVYRNLFPEKEFGAHYILEHHSLTATGTERTEPKTEADEQRRAAQEARLLSENYDSPLIVTTSVQLLESLFSNRPSACRKLHSLARSIILFDEIQTLPLEICVPTLKALSRLTTRKYGTTVVFSTATQPAFGTLHDKIRQGEETENNGWQPREIVPEGLHLYRRARRVTVDWSLADLPMPWDDMAGQIANHRQALCVVNLKRHARLLAEKLISKGTSAIWHLSTSLCPAHRRVLLSRVAEDVRSGRTCRLIATQCVECGVDLDFPAAYRAFAPLDSIAQAAGRCNREGNLKDAAGHPIEGQMIVFLPAKDEEGSLYPPGVYERAAVVTRSLLTERGADGMDIHDPALFDAYYRRLYALEGIEQETAERAKALRDAIKAQSYVRVAELYRVIPDGTVNVIVPYEDKARALIEKIASDGLTGQLMRKARPYTVSLYRSRKRGPDGVPTFLTPARLSRTGDILPDWFLCTFEDRYHPDFGLTPDSDSGFYTA